jgi:acetyl-CoA acyltransferase
MPDRDAVIVDGVTTLVHHMRDRGIRYGLQTMCEGGGLANCTIVELAA